MFAFRAGGRSRAGETFVLLRSRYVLGGRQQLQDVRRFQRCAQVFLHPKTKQDCKFRYCMYKKAMIRDSVTTLLDSCIGHNTRISNALAFAAENHILGRFGVRCREPYPWTFCNIPVTRRTFLSLVYQYTGGRLANGGHDERRVVHPRAPHSTSRCRGRR